MSEKIKIIGDDITFDGITVATINKKATASVLQDFSIEICGVSAPSRLELHLDELDDSISEASIALSCIRRVLYGTY